MCLLSVTADVGFPDFASLKTDLLITIEAVPMDLARQHGEVMNAVAELRSRP